MPRLYDFLSKLSGCLALACAILAVLATPSTSRADDWSACNACCQGQESYDTCMYGCVNQSFGPCATASCSSYDANCCPTCPNDYKEACLNRTCTGTFCDCDFDGVHCHCK